MLRLPLSRSWWQLTLLIGLPILAFGSVITFGFVYDDHWTILHNVALDRPLGELLREIASGGPTTIPDASRPLMVLAMWLERAVFGEDPAGYHAVSLLCHVGCTLLVWRLGRILSRRADVALTAAAFFAVLPANIEAVASINYREDLLATLGILLTLVGVHERVTAPHSWRRALFVGAALALALLGKENALILAVLVPIVAPGTPAWWRLRERTVTVMLAVLGSYVAWRLTLAVGDDGVARSSATFAEATAATPAYLVWCVVRPFWPAQTVPIYEALVPSRSADLLGASLWLVALVWSLRNRSRRASRAPAGKVAGSDGRLDRLRRATRLDVPTARAVASGTLIWLAAPLMTSPWVGPINQRADRYVYLASFGAVLVVVLLCARLSRLVQGRLLGSPSARGSARARWMRRGQLTVTAGLAVGLAATTWSGARVWRSDLELFGHAVAQTPSARSWTALGWAHRRAGQYDEAEDALDRALMLEPERGDTAVILGGLRLVTGDAEGAERIVREQLRETGSGPEPRGLRRLRRCLPSSTPRQCLGDVSP